MLVASGVRASLIIASIDAIIAAALAGS